MSTFVRTAILTQTVSILLNVGPKTFLISQPQLLNQYNCISVSSDCSIQLYSAFKSYSLLILKQNSEGPNTTLYYNNSLLYPTHTFSAFLVISTPAGYQVQNKSILYFLISPSM